MPEEERGASAETAELLVSGAAGAPFGPAFFLTQLRAFARERCPAPEEGLPAVELHLVSGETLDLCHVVGLAVPFVVLAIREDKAVMRTELVPYGLIARITLRTAPTKGPHVGFDVTHEPALLPGAWATTPEDALRSAAALPRAVSASSEGPKGSP